VKYTKHGDRACVNVKPRTGDVVRLYWQYCLLLLFIVLNILFIIILYIVFLTIHHLIGETQCELRYTTETGMLKLFAFVTCVIRILGCGLQTFKLARYRQLNKRIGRLIRQPPHSLLHYLYLSVLLSDFIGKIETEDSLKRMLDIKQS